MRFVDNRNLTDPRINLALEEFLLRRVKIEEPLFLLYVNEPSVIVGRNQNVLEEVDLDYAKENRVHVIRRISGGGAVYHDEGNLNFSFITNNNADIQNFTKFTEPIVTALNRLGVPAEFRNKSDLYVGGKKISGNAQFASGSRMFSHGTILFDTYLPYLRLAIKPGKEGIESNAVQSRRSSVTNTREFMADGATLDDLRQGVLQAVFGEGELRTYSLSEDDWTAVQAIAQTRYHTWEWNIGGSPRFTVRRNGRLPLGEIEIEIDVYKGLIADITISGSFLGGQSLQGLYTALIGTRYDAEALSGVLAEIDLAYYFGLVEEEALLDLIY